MSLIKADSVDADNSKVDWLSTGVTSEDVLKHVLSFVDAQTIICLLAVGSLRLRRVAAAIALPGVDDVDVLLKTPGALTMLLRGAAPALRQYLTQYDMQVSGSLNSCRGYDEDHLAPFRFLLRMTVTSACGTPAQSSTRFLTADDLCFEAYDNPCQNHHFRPDSITEDQWDEGIELVGAHVHVALPPAERIAFEYVTRRGRNGTLSSSPDYSVAVQFTVLVDGRICTLWDTHIAEMYEVKEPAAAIAAVADVNDGGGDVDGNNDDAADADWLVCRHPFVMLPDKGAVDSNIIDLLAVPSVDARFDDDFTACAMTEDAKGRGRCVVHAVTVDFKCRDGFGDHARSVRIVGREELASKLRALVALRTTLHEKTRECERKRKMRAAATLAAEAAVTAAATDELPSVAVAAPLAAAAIVTSKEAAPATSVAVSATVMSAAAEKEHSPETKRRRIV
jgi:hypothetical protein